MRPMTRTQNRPEISAPYTPFAKYSSLLGGSNLLPNRPEGRPIGVRDGMGRRPNVPSNPMLSGLRTSPVPLPGLTSPREMSIEQVMQQQRQQQAQQQALRPPRSTEQAIRPMPMPPQNVMGGELPLMGSSVGPSPMPRANVQNVLSKYGLTGKMRGGY